MNKVKAARKATLLLSLAKNNANEHEAQAATEAANKLLAKYEFGPDELRSTRRVYSGNVTERLNGLLKQLVRCKVWLTYTRKYDDIAAKLAVIQAEMERIVKDSEEIAFKKRKSKHYNTGQLGALRRRYL